LAVSKLKEATWKLSRRIKELREKSGINIAELGRRTLVTPQFIGLLESAQRMPSLIVALRIASVFGITVDELCEGIFDEKEDYFHSRGDGNRGKPHFSEKRMEAIKVAANKGDRG
jgi:putative transcriptional regulator